MILEPLPSGPDLPAPLLTELTALYASHHAFHALGGEFPDPDDVRPEQVAASLAEERARPGADVLLARAEGRLVGIVITLDRHPDPADPDPWIGLLMIDAAAQGRGYGRRLAGLVENRFRADGRAGVRLAVLDGNTSGLAFWTALGHTPLARRPDRALGRPCTVLRKPLYRLRRAARTVVVDPGGAALLLCHDLPGLGRHWVAPGGCLEPGETPRDGARRELREETGWTDLEPEALLCTWEGDLTHGTDPVHQREHVYVTRGPRRPPSDLALHDAESIVAWRWWPRAELATTAEPVNPPDLAALLDAWESGTPGPPADPTG
ncbi:GNAT family N-acetyltransferase [Streptomyces sp. J2-1]|uniref:bifunctional GNAT family N-acetyltransferase/NUDIX hydrolase n=1 Tax=Streptomyces corallincola TaxID=2851888 RepID=UPI001C382507|nr:bifunctional GNAT family N-acetyltransferase/NUDIX hydrolase [Streptomyces corallincola]MBV2354719.1 GNAT family N-acetyltransferase [Streptomyces corallincola]